MVSQMDEGEVGMVSELIYDILSDPPQVGRGDPLLDLRVRYDNVDWGVGQITAHKLVSNLRSRSAV